MRICDILKIEDIIYDFKADSKEDIINQMVDLFKGDARVKDLEKVRATVLEREQIMSTGVGMGFAIPHGKTDAVDDIIAAFARTTNSVDFASLDGEPVNLIFLLVGKEKLVGPHIKLLSRISRMMNKEDFRKSLLNAKSVEELYQIFCAEEEKYINIS